MSDTGGEGAWSGVLTPGDPPPISLRELIAALLFFMAIHIDHLNPRPKQQQQQQVGWAGSYLVLLVLIIAGFVILVGKSVVMVSLLDLVRVPLSFS